MRLRMLALCATLSLTSLAADQANQQRSEEKERFLTEHPSTPPQLDIATPEQERVDVDDVCYTMRSYIFERRDTEAPRPVGVVTCTRSSQRQFKRAKPAPKPKLIPAN